MSSVSVPTVRDEYFTFRVLCTADLGMVVPEFRCDILGQVLCGLSVSDFQCKGENTPMIFVQVL